ncbi:type II secretion system protein E [Ferrimonas balearica DSM 9799]|uniref:Type II secretion system protein E n=2 Tax=Ferrimonas balearica TaxID=44012 RepID=E1SM27_FERBD|nr:CpaF family protein [Ferrimonas balearica]ADN76545.1 type II secretion system protein E [Ferrimonas balearica DSM 9799]MBY6019800.1 CpaF family protein [Halomonas denitrificans]MBY6096867.1 CpaF family protein [Ferrimonas balearica]
MGHESNPDMSLHQQLLSPQEEEVKQDLYERLLSMLDVSKLEVIPEPEARQQITRLCNQILSDNPRPLSLVSRDKIIKQINDEVLGLGPLEPLLADSTISDILINSASSIFVERFGKLEPVPMRFHDDRHLMNIIDKIVSSVGRRVDESSPMVDARLQDGSRVNAIIPPLALDGPSMSIRRFTVDKLTAEQLIDYNAITREMYQVLKAIVEGKLNVLISGGTGSGKTTMLNVLSGYIPSDERIITIEDSAELQLQQPHVVRLESRPANLEGRGEVNQRELVKNSLRMRPDRIVIGEVRGAEALDMLTAMNTGHEGSLTTLHANTCRDALSRLENMVCMAGFDMPVKNIRTQIASAIHVVVQLERQEDGKRRVVSISEITGMEGEVITLSDLFVFRRRGRDKEGNILGEFQATGVIPRFYDELVSKGINLSHGLFGSNESFEII